MSAQFVFQAAQPATKRAGEASMKPHFFVLAAAIAAAPMTAAAVEVKPALELKPKAALMAQAPLGAAPFMAVVAGPELHFTPQREAAPPQGRSSCNADRDLCYDPDSGHIVFKPARQIMPGLPGLTPENILLKKDRILLRYSF
jgi:hypothetical protein